MLKRSVLLALSPILAIVTGWMAAFQADVGTVAFVGNLVGIGVGCCFIFCAVFLSKLLKSYPVQFMSFVVAGISSTLLGPGLEGIHRWQAFGPMQLHLGYILTPLAVSLLFGVREDKRLAIRVLGFILTLVFCWQPDSALATSWNLVFIGALLKDLRKGCIPIFLISTLVIMTAITWIQHDPLVAVPQVESIFRLIAAAGSLEIKLAFIAGLLLASPFVSFSLFKDDDNRPFRVAILIYSVLLFASSLLGNFPVPIFGAGISPVIGWYVALALISGAHQ
jgi:hypothetical protein